MPTIDLKDFLDETFDAATQGEISRFTDLVQVHKDLAEMAVDIRKMVDDSGLTKKTIAERMAISSGKLRRILARPAQVSLETLAIMAWACGNQPDTK